MKDIRLSTEFWSHPKTIKLTRRLGLEGVRSLQILWLWARSNRPDGILTGMDAEDIEIAAMWEGENERFVNESLTIRWLDINENIYELHDWADHNPWSMDSVKRGDKARFSRLAKTHPELYKKMKDDGVTSISSSEYKKIKSNDSFSNKQRFVNERSTTVNEKLTPAPAPAPAPTHNVIDNMSSKKENEERNKVKEKGVEVKREKVITGKEEPKTKDPNKEDREDIISYLNKKAGKNFKASTEATKKIINGRMSEGHTVKDFKRVIDIKTAKWKGDQKMESYLRPQTLFSPSKFEAYLNETMPPVNEPGVRQGLLPVSSNVKNRHQNEAPRATTVHQALVLQREENAKMVLAAMDERDRKNAK